MRIGVDARELCGKPTGVGRYLNALLSRWSALPEARAHLFLLYSPEPLLVHDIPPSTEVHVVRGNAGTWWEQIDLASAVRRDAVDVFFAPGYSAPLRAKAPVALTIHDLSFVAHPEWFSRREGLRRRWMTTRSARAAAVVLTDSEFSRRQIVERLDVAESRVHTIYLGVGHSAVGAPTAGHNAAAREPLVLFVGSIFNRRRLPALIRGFGRLAQDHPSLRLEIIGDNRTHPRQDLSAEAAAAGVGDRVRLRSYVDEATLAGLYARAAAFGFLSEYEGFGLTPLEALSAGVPILVLDTAVAREIYGDAALYVASDDPAGVERGLGELLFDKEHRRAILERAPAVLARYSWERAARETLAAIEAAA